MREEGREEYGVMNNGMGTYSSGVALQKFNLLVELDIVPSERVHLTLENRDSLFLLVALLWCNKEDHAQLLAY